MDAGLYVYFHSCGALDSSQNESSATDLNDMPVLTTPMTDGDDDKNNDDDADDSGPPKRPLMPDGRGQTRPHGAEPKCRPERHHLQIQRMQQELLALCGAVQ